MVESNRSDRTVASRKRDALSRKHNPHSRKHNAHSRKHNAHSRKHDALSRKRDALSRKHDALSRGSAMHEKLTSFVLEMKRVSKFGRTRRRRPDTPPEVIAQKP